MGYIRLWVFERVGIRNLFSMDDFASKAHLKHKADKRLHGRDRLQCPFDLVSTEYNNEQRRIALATGKVAQRT